MEGIEMGTCVHTVLELRSTICSMLQQKPLNVILIGCVGVGKSAFINTIAAAVSQDKWREHAYSGLRENDGEPMTNFTMRFPRCCQPSGLFADKLPTLIDTPGFPDTIDKTWEKILQLLFYGRIPENEDLKFAYDYLKREQIRLPRYLLKDDSLKVDRVIFVCSANEEAPIALIDAVMRAARPVSSACRRTIPVFCVMTKSDIVSSPDDEKVKATQKTVLGRLGLLGSENRFLLCKNYCGDTDPANERTRRTKAEFDKPILEFLIQVCDPAINVIHDEENFPVSLYFQEYFNPYATGVVGVFTIVIVVTYFACFVIIVLASVLYYLSRKNKLRCSYDGFAVNPNLRNCE